MTILDFPANPTPGQVFDRWVWDGESWRLVGAGGAGGAPVVGVSLGRIDGFQVPNNAATALPFNDTYYDTHGFHSDGDSRITIPAGKAGTYLVGYAASFVQNPNGARSAFVSKNGNLAFLAAVSENGPTGAFSRLGATATLELVAGDFIELRVFQESGGALGIQGNNSAAHLLEFYAVKLDDQGGGGGAGSDGFTFTQDTEPTGTTSGQTWFDTSTGNSFVWFDDGNSAQWVQFAPGGGSAPQRIGGRWARVAALPVPSGTITAMAVDTMVEDTDGFIPVLPSGVITIPAGMEGVYTVTAICAVGAPPAIVELIFGGLSPVNPAATGTGSPVTGWASVSVTMFFPAGATIAARVWQNSGAQTNNTNAATLDIWKVA